LEVAITGDRMDCNRIFSYFPTNQWFERDSP
jgi:hypothetical protein